MFLFYLIEIVIVVIVICYYSRKILIKRKIWNVDDIAKDLNSSYGHFFKHEFFFAVYHPDIDNFTMYLYNRDGNELTKMNVLSDDDHISPKEFFYDIAKQAFVKIPPKPTIDGDGSNGIVMFKNQLSFIQMNFENNITVDAKENVFRLMNNDNNNSFKNEIMYRSAVPQPPIITKTNVNGCEKVGDLLPVSMSKYKKYFNIISKNFENDSLHYHSYLYFECMSDGSVVLNRCLPNHKFSITSRNCVEQQQHNTILEKQRRRKLSTEIDSMIHAEEKRKCMSLRKAVSLFNKIDENPASSILLEQFNFRGYFECNHDGTLAKVVECNQKKQNLIVSSKYMSEVFYVPEEYFDKNLSKCVAITTDHIRPIRIDNLYYFIPYKALSENLLFNPQNDTLVVDLNQLKTVYIPTLQHNSFHKLNEISQRYELVTVPMRFIIFNDEFYPLQVPLNDIPYKNVSTELNVDSLESSLVKWSDDQKTCANMIGEVVLDYTQFDPNSEFNGKYIIVNNNFDIVPSWMEFRNRFGHNNFKYFSTADLYKILNGIENLKVDCSLIDENRVA